MSSPFSSATDETGSGGNVIHARRMEDIAVFDGTKNMWILNRGSANIIRYTLFQVFSPILITANDTLRMMSFLNGDSQFFYAGAGALFQTLPIGKGDITVFADAGGGNTLVTSTAHGLNANDTVKIENSRVASYNGNHVITAFNANGFIIPIPFVGADGPCNWVRTEVYFTGTTGSDGDTTTNLAMIDHPFVAGDWIQVLDSNISSAVEYQINSVVAGVSVNITAPFTVTSTGNVNVALNTCSLLLERVNSVNSGPLFDIQGRSGVSGVGLSNCILVNRNPITFGVRTDALWDLGETRDFSFNVWVQDTIGFSIAGLKSFGNGTLLLTDFAVNNRQMIPFNTEDYAPIISTSENSAADFSLRSGIWELSKNSSIALAPQGVSESFRMQMADINPATDPGFNFSPGYYARATGIPEDEAAKILVRFPDTTKFRVGDSITLSETSSYNDTPTTILSIDPNVSINLNLAFIPLEVDTATGPVIDNGDGTITMNTVDTSGLTVGDWVTISGVEPTAYNALYELLALTQYTITVTGVSVGSITTDGQIFGNSRPLILDTSLASLDQTDPQVTASNNTGLANSVSIAESSLSPLTGDFITVVVGGPNQDVWFNIDTTGSSPIITWVESSLERFEPVDIDLGSMVYTGLEDASFNISWRVTFEEAGGGTNQMEAAIFINGALPSQTIPAIYNNNGIVQVVGAGIFALVTGDVVDLRVRNTGGTLNIEVYQAVFDVVKGG